MEEKNVIGMTAEPMNLYGQTEAKLLYVGFRDIDERTPEKFIEYQTRMVDGSRRKLGNDSYIVLVFLGNLGIPFTVLRINTLENVTYLNYSSYVGETFKIDTACGKDVLGSKYASDLTFFDV